MATDIILDTNTHEIVLDPITKDISLFTTQEGLVRQRLQIALSTFRGEWVFDELFGLPYFQSIFKKNSASATDLAVRSLILETEGVAKIINYESSLDKSTRQYNITFTCQVESGEIISGIEVTI